MKREESKKHECVKTEQKCQPIVRVRSGLRGGALSTTPIIVDPCC
jgi:hypothetical protein